MSGAELVDVLGSAIQLTAIYGVVNIGFVYLYRTTGVINFAQGQMLMLAAFVLTALQPLTGVAGGIVLTLGAMLLAGLVVYYGFARLLGGKTELTKVALTFLLALGLTQAAGIVWGSGMRSVTIPTGGYLRLAGGLVPWASVVSLAGAAALAFVLERALRSTYLGVQMRAIAEDESLAAYRGMRCSALQATAWAVAFLCATLAAVVYVERAPVVLSMSAVGLSAFPAAVIGGMDNIGGAFVGAVVVALAESFTAVFLGGAVANALSYALMLAVLVVLPYGLLGRRPSVRL